MKRLSMLKLLSILLISSFFSVANAKTIEQRILSFEKHRVSQNPAIKLKNIKLVFKKDLEDNWKGYVYKLDLTLKGKDIHVNDIIFSNGNLVTAELRNLHNLDLKRKMHPILDKRYYQDSHLIAGNKNAKHKLVIFSDPLCPICTSETPKIIQDVQEHPNIFALYYISFPLDMHPTAKTIAKAAMVLHSKGFKNSDYKVYTAGLDFYFDPYKNKDNKKSLDALNKVLKTNITMKQINNPLYNKRLQEDIKLANDAFVNGTPTLFLDGEVDLTRSQYKKYIK